MYIGDCGVCVVGKKAKNIGKGVRKGTVVSFIPTLFGYILEIPFLYVFSCFEMFFFVTCFRYFFAALQDNVGEDGLGVHSSGGVLTPFNAHHGGYYSL